MIRRPPRSTLDRSSAASDVYKRQWLDEAQAPAITVGGETVKADRTEAGTGAIEQVWTCLLYTSPSPRDPARNRMPSFALKKKKNTHGLFTHQQET